MSSLHLGTFALFILPDTSRCRNNNRSGLQSSIKISAQIGRTSTMKPTFDHFLDFLTSYLRLRKRWSAGLSTAPNLPWRADPMISSRGVSHHCPLSFCRHAVIHSQEIWDKVLQPRLESHQLIPCPLSHQKPLLLYQERRNWTALQHLQQAVFLRRSLLASPTVQEILTMRRQCGSRRSEGASSRRWRVERHERREEYLYG